jgi:lysophospholipase L1-like esterase
MRFTLSSLLLIILSTTLNAATFIPASDSHILYTGRWDNSSPAEPWAFAKGTSIMANFDGSNLSASITATTTDYLRVVIDDNVATSVKIPIEFGTSTYQLATDLSPVPGGHKIEIIKESDGGRWTLHGFNLDNGAGLREKPTPPNRRIVFYGDSNLAGYSLEHEQNQSDREYRGSYYGFAGILSRMMGAEYSNISRSGASIRSLHASFDRIDWFSSSTPWDFERFQPHLVVINIGANDVGRPESRIKKGYKSLLDDMRVVYPDAHIMLYNGWGWDYQEPANYTHEVIAAWGDSDMSSAVFPWVFEQWHGCEYDHSGMAHVLADHLADVLGWEPVAEADVMNGYGSRDGNVANGGFEQVAPFGGYGWRYFEDTGVSREKGAAVDQGGEYFLRLENGAASHQPNPAMPGQTFAVSAWVRSQDFGDQIRVTIDFRDQNMWTDPLQSETGVFTLSTTKWTRIDMEATAPVATARPVFHTRLTFQAGSESTIDIDNVFMQLVDGSCTDNDDDGYGLYGSLQCSSGSGEADCDDTRALVNPGALENCDNTLDDDCNGLSDDDDPACPVQQCAVADKSCSKGQDCCSGNCSKGKPSSRVCIG